MGKMINLKTKFVMLFLLFNIILLLNMFRKVKETNYDTSCKKVDFKNSRWKLEKMFDCKAKNFRCLSLNCNKHLNGIFNIHLTGGKLLDNNNENLSAYCCKKCRDTGGCECDDTCASHATNDTENIKSISNSCKDNKSIYDGFTSKKEGYADWQHGKDYHNTVSPYIYGNYECNDGIIDPANCDCYRDDINITDWPSSKTDASNCGAYRFHNCQNDIGCLTNLNRVRMRSF